MSHLLYNERMLLGLIARDNENAFRELYDEYFPRLSSYVFKLCKSAYITEEVLQEVFMKLWMNRSLLNHIEVPEAYILSIAKNTTIDWLRKLSRQTDLIVNLATQIEEYGNDAELKMNADSLESLIADSLKQLSDRKQKVYRLNKIAGLSHDEIAAKLHLSKSTVKNHLSETIKHIRKQIQPHVPSEILLLLMLLYSVQQ